MKDTDVAWLAGLFEGEGNIYAGGSTIQITIAMTDLDIIDRVDSICPGKRYTRERKHSQHKTLYVWRLYGKPAVEFLETIRVYLGNRRLASANLAIEKYYAEHDRQSRLQNKVEEVSRLSELGLSRQEIAKEMSISEVYVSKLRKVQFN